MQAHLNKQCQSKAMRSCQTMAAARPAVGISSKPHSTSTVAKKQQAAVQQNLSTSSNPSRLTLCIARAAEAGTAEVKQEMPELNQENFYK